MSQGRLERGAEAQEYFSTILENYNAKTLFVAPKGSNKPDIIFSDSDIKYQAEVKSTNDFSSVTIFDKTVTRGKENPDVDNLIRKLRGFSSFEKYIDHLRKEKGSNYVGFVGDTGIEGVSGRIPIALDNTDFRFNSPKDKNVFIEMIRNHWATNNDDFFVLMQAGGKRFAVFSATQRSNKILGSVAVPFSARHIDEVFLATSGSGGGNGKIRVALKILLNTGSIKTKIASLK
jgi:hypothetical protein